MNVLVINAGSSSLKYQLLDPATGDLLASSGIQQLILQGGAAGSRYWRPAGQGPVRTDRH